MFKKTSVHQIRLNQPQADAERLSHSMLDVGRSMFDVQKKHPPIESARINPRRTLSGSHIRCSMFKKNIRPSNPPESTPGGR
jgi:hypothetical protein